MNRTLVALWILATAYLSIEAAFMAGSRSFPAPTDEQTALVLDHVEQIVWILGPRMTSILLVATLLWLLQGIIGLVFVAWSTAAFFRFAQDHARRQREALAAHTQEAGHGQ
jgi:hypothetical protein